MEMGVVLVMGGGRGVLEWAGWRLRSCRGIWTGEDPCFWAWGIDMVEVLAAAGTWWPVPLPCVRDAKAVAV